MYSFCPNDVAPHIAAIKALQDALGDQQTFMHCLAVLVTLESAFNEDMLDKSAFMAWKDSVDTTTPGKIEARKQTLAWMTYIENEDSDDEDDSDSD